MQSFSATELATSLKKEQPQLLFQEIEKPQVSAEVQRMLDEIANFPQARHQQDIAIETEREIVRETESKKEAETIGLKIEKVERKEEDENISMQTASLQSLNHRHHRAAQLIAEGKPYNEVAAVCSYSYQTVVSLKNDSSFKNLVEYYRSKINQENSALRMMLEDVVISSMESLSKQIQNENVSAKTLVEFIPKALDRLNMSPVTRTQNLNVDVTSSAISELKKSLGIETLSESQNKRIIDI